jgi:hypothetical protein
VRRKAWHAFQPAHAKGRRPHRDWDAVESSAPASAKEIPPVTRKWRIAYTTPQQDFLDRARDILSVRDGS